MFETIFIIFCITNGIFFMKMALEIKYLCVSLAFYIDLVNATNRFSCYRLGHSRPYVCA